MNDARWLRQPTSTAATSSRSVDVTEAGVLT